MLGRHHLTTRFQNWNTFYVDHPATGKLFEVVQEGHDKYCNLHDFTVGWRPSIQSWVNVLRSGDDIGRYCHVSSASHAHVYMSTNFCVTADEDTATVYDLPGYEDRQAVFRNSPGQLLVFPSWIPHYTTAFEQEDATRITIASDISFDYWSEISFSNGERFRHWLPFDTHPGVKCRENSQYEELSDIPAVDGTIAQLVNYEGELTENVVREMKETGTDFAKNNVYPEGYDSEIHDHAGETN